MIINWRKKLCNFDLIFKIRNMLQHVCYFTHPCFLSAEQMTKCNLIPFCTQLQAFQTVWESYWFLVIDCYYLLGNKKMFSMVNLWSRLQCKKFNVVNTLDIHLLCCMNLTVTTSQSSKIQCFLKVWAHPEPTPMSYVDCCTSTVTLVQSNIIMLCGIHVGITMLMLVIKWEPDLESSSISN